MFAVKPLSPFRSEVSGPVFRLPPPASGVGRRSRAVVGRRLKVNGGAGWVRAVVSGGDNKTVEAEKPVDGKDLNGSLPSSSSSLSSSSSSGKIDVRAVISIRKKIRQKLVDKIEDSLESFMNGIGQGIMLQLVSEEVDPGQSVNQD